MTKRQQIETIIMMAGMLAIMCVFAFAITS